MAGVNLILLGPQGSGKGTQAELLVEKFGLNYFEAGRILRSIANSDNPNASMIKGTIDKGGLVPDEFVRLIAWDFINKNDINYGFLFDGYPRSVPQYEQLQEMLRRFGRKINCVINLEISEEESVKRLSARRTCNTCGRVYNLITNSPPSATCECGGHLLQRADDQPEAIKRRLAIYRSQTHPVFERAKQEGVGLEINGEQSIEAIHKAILDKIQSV
jgi:adenylate kinase